MKPSKAGVAVASLMALAACGQKPQQQAVPSLNDAMRGVMEPKAEVIWNTASKAYNPQGDGLDPRLLSDGDWSKMADAAAAMKDRAQLLLNADHLLVAQPNEPILGSQAVGIKGNIGPAWDAVSAKTIQTRIDADPKKFAAKLQVLLDSATAMEHASRTRDIGELYRVSGGLDEVCDGCHEPFWGTDEPPAPPASMLRDAGLGHP